jgi:hypothetical protein
MPKRLTPNQLETLKLIRDDYIRLGKPGDPAPALTTLIAKYNELRPQAIVGQNTVYTKKDEENWDSLRSQYHDGTLEESSLWLMDQLDEGESDGFGQLIDDTAQRLHSAQEIVQEGVGQSAQVIKQQTTKLILTVLNSLCSPETLAMLPVGQQINLLRVLRQIDQDANKNLGLEEQMRRESEQNETEKQVDFYVDLGVLDKIIDHFDKDSNTNPNRQNLQKGLDDIERRNQ